MSLSQIHEMVKCKRESFRYEIRRQKLENVFAQKRTKLLYQQSYKEHIVPHIDRHNSLQALKALLGTFSLSRDPTSIDLLLAEIIKHLGTQLRREDKLVVIDEVFELMRNNGSLSMIIELIDLQLNHSFVEKAIWIIINLLHLTKAVQILVYDTTLLDRIGVIMDSDANKLISEAFDVYHNILLDDISFFKEIVGRRKLLSKLSQLSVSPLFKKECSTMLMLIGYQLVSQYEQPWKKKKFSTLLYCLSQTSSEYNSLITVSHMLQQNSESHDSTEVAVYIIENHFGLLGKIIGNLEILIARNNPEQLLFLKISLRIVAQLAEMREEIIDETLINLRVTQIISKIFAVITKGSILAITCQIITHLIEDETFLNNLSPFIIQELFKQAQHSQDEMLSLSALKCISRLVELADEEKIKFIIMHDIVGLLIDKLHQPSHQLICLRTLHVILSAQDNSCIVHQINKINAWIVLEDLTHASNQDVQRSANEILLFYNEIQIFLA